MTTPAASEPPHRPEPTTRESREPVGAVLLVGVGGALGTLLRLMSIGAEPEPVGLLAVNVAGSAALGVLTAVLLRHTRRQRPLRAARWRLFLGTGLCGGFTSYSAIAVAVHTLAAGGSAALAVLYALVTVLLGCAAVWGAERATALLCVGPARSGDHESGGQHV